MTGHEPGAARWVKSGYSGNDGGNCLEFAPEFMSVVPIRDSKTPDGPVIVVGRSAWSVFVAGVPLEVDQA
ncbi:DUF397 domain-containing protein [Streptomyces sp. NPDC091215]|uniref:DUF397 domain-containing protein n=1 Tax=Streptomyces sp. NPDC091215 TaxID=3155192 RepID=UPI0034435F0A